MSEARRRVRFDSSHGNKENHCNPGRLRSSRYLKRFIAILIFNLYIDTPKRKKYLYMAFKPNGFRFPICEVPNMELGASLLFVIRYKNRIILELRKYFPDFSHESYKIPQLSHTYLSLNSLLT